jgi:tRNA threonylcarbamoyl adenosine modification protein YeaZ
MKILAIDTSVGVSIALLDSNEIIDQFTDTKHGIQGELTSAKITELLNKNSMTAKDLTDIVVGVGPGPYTGLRVGLATAQALGFALNIPVYGICSLDAVAFEFGKPCVVVTDARRKELYWAKYDQGRIGEPQVNKPSEIVEQVLGSQFVGPAVALYPEVLSGKQLTLNASSLGQLFASGSAKTLPVSPLYLRKPDAVEPTNRKSVL